MRNFRMAEFPTRNRVWLSISHEFCMLLTLVKQLPTLTMEPFVLSFKLG